MDNTVAMLKVNNKRKILEYIYSLKKTTPYMIAEKLNLSRPTIAQILKELTEDQLVCMGGFAQSTGGRKANMYVFNASGKIAIGLELVIDHFEMIAVDLYADMLKYERVSLPFLNSDDYYAKVADSVNAFIASLNVEPDKILGVGIALQALISADGKTVIYGKILDCTGLDIRQFSDRIPYKCMFNHDAESLANSELWYDSSIKDAIFFNIRDNLSGAVIINGEFFRGGELKSGVFEHMTIVPDGRPCYCGKKGCVNSYCSISAFLNPDEEADAFFAMLRAGDEAYEKRWEQYLKYLAIVIDNLHMFITSEVILGGTLSKYLVNDDLVKLGTMIHERSAFPGAEKYIKISKCANLPLCVGAALPLVNKYLKNVIK